MNHCVKTTLHGLLLFLTVPPLCAQRATSHTKPAATQIPWFMKATEMTSDGRLTFLNQPWWSRAQHLKEGESFTLDLSGDGKPDTLISRKDGNIVEAINDSGAGPDIQDQSNTAFVVSYKGSGTVDRMVVYTDNNHDHKADEMEIRYYKDGYLRYAWFGENYDNDGAQIFHLTNWQYDGRQFESKFRGNAMIYINKYDPRTKSWVPLSECPFAFYDPNHDGLGEIVVRDAVQTEEAARGNDLDLANSYAPMWQDEPLSAAQMRLANVRLSYNIDPEPRHDALDKPHYNFGFTMRGQANYTGPTTRYTNPRRRAPQTVVRIDWKSVPSVALRYKADMTGFTWDESRSVHRWEGQFWIYERRIIANTGGPVWRWNMRREYSGASSSSRQMYYSGIDHRYHMRGASEMWLEVGHLVNDAKDMEIRAYDTDGDGYLDRWEIFRDGSSSPVRVTQVTDPKAHPIALDRKLLLHEYNEKILPAAVAEDEQLIAALKPFAHSGLAQKYEAAAQQSDMQERKRYLLDVARELYYLAARDALYAASEAAPYPALANQSDKRTAAPGPIDGHFTMGDTLAYWKKAASMEQFERAYGQGDFAKAASFLKDVDREKH